MENIAVAAKKLEEKKGQIKKVNNQSALAKDELPGFWLERLPILFISQLI